MAAEVEVVEVEVEVVAAMVPSMASMALTSSTA